jgi:hypothetical protein
MSAACNKESVLMNIAICVINLIVQNVVVFFGFDKNGLS